MKLKIFILIVVLTIPYQIAANELWLKFRDNSKIGAIQFSQDEGKTWGPKIEINKKLRFRVIDLAGNKSKALVIREWIEVK